MKKRKIALFIPSLAGGGAQKMMLHLAQSFSENNFDVDFIIAQKINEYNKYKQPKNINCIFFEVEKIKYSLFPLIKYLRKEKPDILLSTLVPTNVVSIIAKLLSRSKTKVVIRIANTMSPVLKDLSWKHRLKIKINMAIFYRLANKIVTNSKGSAEDLTKTLKIPKNKVAIINNPTVTPEIIRKSLEEINHPWLNNKDNPIILGVGRLTKQKDFPTLIKAFKIVRKEYNAKLIILGEGEEREYLEKLIKKLNLEPYVLMPGFVKNPYAYMSKVDVFVLSSLHEGSPNALIEALACGAQIISTDCPHGPKEILENGKYGKLVPIENEVKMAEDIKQVFKHPFKKSILKERGSYFSAENSTKKYLDIFETLN